VAVPAQLSRSRRHVRLTVAGPFDIILDATRTGRGRRARFQDAFFQLRPGGVLIVRGAGEKSTALRPDWALLHRAAASRAGPAPVPGGGTPLTVIDDHALGEGCDDARNFGGHLVVRSRATGVLAKLREHETNSYLRQQAAPRHLVVELIPSEPFTSRCLIREPAPPRGREAPRAFEPPDISLRDNHDVVVTPGQVVSYDRVIFPDTYRHNARWRLRESVHRGGRSALRAAPALRRRPRVPVGYLLPPGQRGARARRAPNHRTAVASVGVAGGEGASAGSQAPDRHQQSGRGAALRAHCVRRRRGRIRGRGHAPGARAGRAVAVGDADAVEPSLRPPQDRGDVAKGG